MASSQCIDKGLTIVKNNPIATSIGVQAGLLCTYGLAVTVGIPYAGVTAIAASFASAFKFVSLTLDQALENEKIVCQEYISASLPSSEITKEIAKSLFKVNYLIEQGIPLNKIDSQGSSILAKAFSSHSDDNVEVLKQILAQNKYDAFTVLYLAIDSNISKEVGTFIEKTDLINVDTLTDAQKIALIQKARYSSQKLQFLKNRGIDLDIKDKQGLTLLMKSSSIKIIATLISLGADPFFVIKLDKKDFRLNRKNYTIMDMPLLRPSQKEVYSFSRTPDEQAERTAFLTSLFMQMGLWEKMKKHMQDVAATNV